MGIYVKYQTNKIMKIEIKMPFQDYINLLQEKIDEAGKVSTSLELSNHYDDRKKEFEKHFASQIKGEIDQVAFQM